MQKSTIVNQYNNIDNHKEVTKNTIVAQNLQLTNQSPVVEESPSTVRQNTMDDPTVQYTLFLDKNLI